MKKYSLKELSWTGALDTRTNAGYGTLKQTMKPQKMADGFPYDIHKNKENIDAEDNGFIDDLDDMNKFQSMTNHPSQPIEKDNLNFRYDRKSYIDGETRGVSDSVLKNYIDLIIEFALTLTPRSSHPDYVTDQWGGKILNGTKSGWSRAYPFEDEESEERVFSFQDLVDKYNEKEGID